MNVLRRYDDILDKYDGDINKAMKDPEFDQYIHERIAQDYGNYVKNPAIAGLFRGVGEIGQLIQYSIIYDQNHPNNWKYDPLGRYDPSKKGIAPLYGGIEYLKDIPFDIKNTIDGAQNKFNPKFYEK